MKLINYLTCAAIFFVAATFAAPTFPEETPKEIMTTFPIAPNDTETDSILAEDLTPKIIPEPVEEKTDEKMNQRKKKSATTTFCVEVKPNNPYQKPYELCESGNEIYAVPSDNSHYNAPAAPSAPVPVYGAPQKTYGTPTNYVQSAPTSSSYKTATKTYETKKYRANEEHEIENSDEEEEFHDGMRSGYGAGYGYGANLYGGGLSKKHKKHGHGHSGVVITCQPNLAGYASPVQPGNAGYGAAYGGGYGVGYGGAHGYAGSYRNSNPTEDVDQMQMKNMENPRLGKSYSNYGSRNPSYGNYGYNPIPSRPNSYSSASATSFVAPHSMPNLAPQPIPNLIQPQIPLSGQYSAPPQSYLPPPSYPAPSFPSPSYQQTYSAPTYPSSYANAASGVSYDGFKAQQQQQPQKGGSFSSASSFVAPGTYRSTDNDKIDKMESKDMMMKKMEDDRHWNQEMRSEGEQQQKETMTNEEKM